MPRLSETSLRAGLHAVYIDNMPTIRPPEPPAEDMELLSARVMRTYGSENHIKRFELIFATRTVEIDVSNPEHCWRGFDFAANANLLANLFLLALKRPNEVISARDEGRFYQARVAQAHIEQAAEYASGGTVTINGGSPVYVNGNDYVYQLAADYTTTRWLPVRDPANDNRWTLVSADRPDGT